MATVHVPNPNAAPVIVGKNGECTGKKMFQVRGDPHWYSSPTIALDTHNRMKKFIADGGFAKKAKAK